MKMLGAVAGAVLVTAGIVANVGAKPEQKGPQVGQFSSVQVTLDERFISPDRKRIHAFVPTGSADRRVLVSLNEYWIRGHAGTVSGFWANARTSDVLGPGVYVGGSTKVPLPDKAVIVLTVAQPRANFKEPVPLDLSKQLKAP